MTFAAPLFLLATLAGLMPVVLHLMQIETTATVLCRGLSERGLPNLWLPGERDFFPVPQLPLLGSGKLDLKGVKDMALSAVQSK